jgi:hypothetical protein
MTSADTRNIFQDDFLKFSVHKPSRWEYLPAVWSPVALLQRSKDRALEWVKHANRPFCCAMLHHDSASHAYATMQVTVRPSQVPHGDRDNEFNELLICFGSSAIQYKKELAEQEAKALAESKKLRNG